MKGSTFKILLGIGGVVVTIVVIFLFMFLLRWFNAATIQIKVTNPKPGIECVIASTTDGASIDCYKVGNQK